MKLFGNKRGIYVATGALLTTFVVTSGSILTYLLISPEIEKGKDRNNLDVVRNVLRDLDSRIRDLLNKGPNSTSIFSMALPKGEIRASPIHDVLAYSVKTRVTYDPGSTSNLLADKTDDNVLTLTSQLPVDLVTKNTRIYPGRYTVILTFEKEARFRIANWTLYKGANFTGTVGSTTGSYYTSSFSESDYNIDLNRDNDMADYWLLYLSDPNEDYVFDSVAVHNSDGTLVKILEEGNSFKLNGVPLIVYRVRERYVVLRYARIRMELK